MTVSDLNHFVEDELSVSTNLYIVFINALYCSVKTISACIIISTHARTSPRPLPVVPTGSGLGTNSDYLRLRNTFVYGMTSLFDKQTHKPYKSPRTRVFSLLFTECSHFNTG